MEKIEPLFLQLSAAVKKYGNTSKLLRDSGIDRRSLYRMLSDRGNPRISSIEKLLKFLGLEIKIAKSTNEQMEKTH